MRRALTLLFAISVSTAAAAADTARVEAARLRFAIPITWTRVPALGENEAARYRVPTAEGDLAESVLVLRVQANLDAADEQLEHWYTRFTQPDGQPTAAAAAVLKRTVGDLRITRTDVSGTYGGSGGSIPARVSGYRLLGAIVEGEGGPWVFEILGPRATVGAARADFDAMLLSLERH